MKADVGDLAIYNGLLSCAVGFGNTTFASVRSQKNIHIE